MQPSLKLTTGFEVSRGRHWVLCLHSSISLYG